MYLNHLVNILIAFNINTFYFSLYITINTIIEAHWHVISTTSGIDTVTLMLYYMNLHPVYVANYNLPTRILIKIGCKSKYLSAGSDQSLFIFTDYSYLRLE